MNDFGALIGHLTYFIIRNGVYCPCIFNNPRICRHNSLNICVNIYRFRIKGNPKC